MIPRWIIDVYLLWLGCRWLCATPNFGDLLLNSVRALEAGDSIRQHKTVSCSYMICILVKPCELSRYIMLLKG